MFRNWSITVKTTVALLLVALLPMIGTSVYNLNQGLAHLAETETDNLEELALRIGDRLDQLVEITQIAAKQLVIDNQVIRVLTDSTPDPVVLRSVTKTFDQIIKTNPQYELIYLLDRDGRVVVSRQLPGLPTLEGKSYADREYFRQALAGTEYVDVLVSRSNGRLGYYFSTPVYDADRSIIGVAVIKLQSAAVTKVINDFNDKNDSNFAFLVDQDGVIVIHPNEELLKHSVVPLSQEAQRRVGMRLLFPECDEEHSFAGCIVPPAGIDGLSVLANTTAASSVRYDWPQDGSDESGKPQIAGYAPSEKLNWVVAVNTSLSSFRQPLAELTRRNAINVALAAALVGLFSVILARSIVRPIGQLALVAQDVEQDKPFQPNDISDVTRQGDEVGHLARVFSAMVLSLRARMADLTTIYQIGRQISSSVELEDTLRYITDALHEVIPFDKAEISLFDERRNRLEVQPLDGEVHEKPVYKKLDEGYIPMLIERQISLLIPYLSAYSAAQIDPNPAWIELGAQSYLGVALRRRDSLVGTIEFLSSKRNCFTEENGRLLENISLQAALAIHNAREVQVKERRLKRQIRDLRIAIDRAKQESEVEKIAGSDYFQSLKKQAARIRASRKDRSDLAGLDTDPASTD